ncbi:hypothetical protein JKP88DRAFT_338307 [Tribonema minus]|uniref:Uncharacterized protein n=1 Tax=Tribonema minus TaxID=303371 RepID=A0A836C7H9_9STRA|nr:hypothetical protein JKP88DRAFT_338307 [Tribonema minus]
MSDPEHSTSVEKTTADRLADVLIQLKPVFTHLEALTERAQPLLTNAELQARSAWAGLQPYHPEALGPILLGLALVFAGGAFPTLVTAVEAVRVSGTWPGVVDACGALRANYKAARAAQEKDDQVDADRDGIADVAQADARALLRRRGALLLKSVNADQVADAAQRLAAALLAVLATLRVRAARALAIGTALGRLTHDWCGAVVTEAAARALPPDARRAAPALVACAFRAAGVLAAAALARPVFAAFVAQRGAALAVGAAADLALRARCVAPGHWADAQRVRLAAALGAAGFAVQWWRAFQLAFALRVALLPLSAVEWALTLCFAVLV